MGLFGTIRNMMSQENKLQEFWSVPKTEEDVDHRIETSKSGLPQIIYKHSYRCGISLFAKSSLDAGIKDLQEESGIKAHLVDVIGMRAVSNYIADKTGIGHQSPQIILLYNGSPFWSASHGDVRLEKLRGAVNELGNQC